MDEFPEDLTADKVIERADVARAKKQAETLRIARKRVYDDIIKAADSGADDARIDAAELQLDSSEDETLRAEIAARFPAAQSKTPAGDFRIDDEGNGCSSFQWVIPLRKK
jgi:hypothetical protein